MKIGNISIEGNIFLAPMAGYTDSVFRGLCLGYGASLAYTEMVSSEGLARDSAPTKALMERAHGEKNLAVQLFMPDEDTAYRCIRPLMKENPQIIDINCGCPVPKVIRTCCGSALMKTPERIGAIVRTFVEETGLPVTVKIRAGWDTESLSYLECAQSAFSFGASAVCMHARTRSQLYAPFAHWEYIKDLKDHFPDRTIIGSGDLFSANDCIRMLDFTGCDAVAVARGAIGNPFIFREIREMQSGQSITPVSMSERVSVIMDHLEKEKVRVGEARACREMRKHVCAYLKGVPGGSRARLEITKATTSDMYKRALDLLNCEI